MMRDIDVVRVCVNECIIVVEQVQRSRCAVVRSARPRIACVIEHCVRQADAFFVVVIALVQFADGPTGCGTMPTICHERLPVG